MATSKAGCHRVLCPNLVRLTCIVATSFWGVSQGCLPSCPFVAQKQRAPLELDAKENPLAGNGLMLGAELTPEQDPRRGFEGEGLRYPATLPASEGGGRL